MTGKIVSRKFYKYTGLTACLVITLIGLALTFNDYRKWRQERQNNSLISAIQRNDVREVVALLDEGADANAQYIPWDVHSLEAIHAGHPPGVASDRSFWQALIDDIYGRHNREGKGLAALIVALDNRLECPSDTTLPPKKTEIIAVLLEKGADVNARGRENETPLLLALWENRNDVINLLLRHKASVKLKNDNGNTTLMEAAFQGNTELVSYLLDQGVDANLQNEYGCTALMLAIHGRSSNDVRVVQVLLDHHAGIDFVDKDGDTALTMAEQSHKVKIVYMLKPIDRKPYRSAW